MDIKINIILEKIALILDNTFIGTLFAGLIIAYSGIWLYRKQKMFDIETSRKEKLHDLAVNLLTQINVAMQDYLGQIRVHDGSNPKAKFIFTRMEEFSPGAASRDTSTRFNKYITNITQALNDLSTPLALNNGNEAKVKTLAEAIPGLNFLFSAASTLSMNNVEGLKNVRELALEYSDKSRKVLEEIING